MKYEVKVGDRSFEVEVKNIYARPVIVIVDGVEFEVWLQPQHNQNDQPESKPVRSATENRQAIRVSAATRPGSNGNIFNNSNSREVRAPIPGVIVSISVQPGAQVSVGDELCVLEAMKMKNAIRAARSGTIAAIYANIGQHVKQRDVLLEFEE